MVTITIYDYIQSELIKQGFNEFVNDDGELIYFDDSQQFLQKVFSFDNDIYELMNVLFLGNKLDDETHDNHFKKSFLYKFSNRQINRQTIESFQMNLAHEFMTQKNFIESIYNDLEKYIEGKSSNKQENKQVNDGTTTTDNRNAFANLAQNQVNINVDSTTLKYADENTISRNKQTNHQNTDGLTMNENKVYQFDNLIQSTQIMEELYNHFDKKCFLQVW